MSELDAIRSRPVGHEEWCVLRSPLEGDRGYPCDCGEADRRVLLAALAERNAQIERLREALEVAISFGHNLAAGGLGHSDDVRLGRDAWKVCSQKLCRRIATLLDEGLPTADEVYGILSPENRGDRHFLPPREDA